MKGIAAFFLAGMSLLFVIVLIIVTTLGGLLVPEETHLFSSIVTAALGLQDHISGSRSNLYDIHDPFMQPVLDYWATSCPGNGPGGVCELAESGHLQCVEFVTAAYFLAGDPLPVAPDAEQFWETYATLPGWQRIPSPSAFPTVSPQVPHPGDLMVFKGGAHLEQGRTEEFGHIGIVVSFTAPTASADGSIEIAQGNGPGTKFPPLSTHPWVASDKPGNTYVMTVHPDYRIETWGPYSLGGVAYSGLTVLGFLHDAAFAQKQTSTDTAQGLSMLYVQEAWQNAPSFGMEWSRHIETESGFNPSTVSPVGTIALVQCLSSSGLSQSIHPLEAPNRLQQRKGDQSRAASQSVDAFSLLVALVNPSRSFWENTQKGVIYAFDTDSLCNHLFLAAPNGYDGCPPSTVGGRECA